MPARNFAGVATARIARSNRRRSVRGASPSSSIGGPHESVALNRLLVCASDSSFLPRQAHPFSVQTRNDRRDGACAVEVVAERRTHDERRKQRRRLEASGPQHVSSEAGHGGEPEVERAVIERGRGRYTQGRPSLDRERNIARVRVSPTSPPAAGSARAASGCRSTSWRRPQNSAGSVAMTAGPTAPRARSGYRAAARRPGRTADRVMQLVLETGFATGERLPFKGNTEQRGSISGRGWRSGFANRRGRLHIHP